MTKTRNIAPMKLELLMAVVHNEKAAYYSSLIQQHQANLQFSLPAKGTTHLVLSYAASPLTLTTDDRGALWIGGFSGTLVRYDKRDKSRQDVSVVKPGEWTFTSDLLLEEPGKLLVPRFGMMPAHVNTYNLECTDRQVSPNDQNATIRRSVVIPNRVLKE